MVASTNDERAYQLRELGEMARRNRDLASAQAYYEEASNLLRGSPNRLKFAHTVRHLGDVYTERHGISSGPTPAAPRGGSATVNAATYATMIPPTDAGRACGEFCAGPAELARYRSSVGSVAIVRR
jgi:hypothetical protein